MGDRQHHEIGVRQLCVELVGTEHVVYPLWLVLTPGVNSEHVHAERLA